MRFKRLTYWLRYERGGCREGYGRASLTGKDFAIYFVNLLT